MKKAALVLFVFFALLAVTHLFLLWACRTVGVEMTSLAFFIHFLVAVVGTVYFAERIESQ